MKLSAGITVGQHTHTHTHGNNLIDTLPDEKCLISAPLVVANRQRRYRGHNQTSRGLLQAEL